MPFEILDPSILIGFYFAQSCQLEDFIVEIEKYIQLGTGFLSIGDFIAERTSLSRLDEF